MATFTIRGKNIEVTPALRDYVEKKVGKVTKYFDNVGEITVLLTVSKDRHIVEVTVPVQGILLRGQEATMDMYTSIDLVIEKIERQIRKNKTKIERKNKNKVATSQLFTDALVEDANVVQPKVVRSKQIDLKPMDLEEAILQMDLLGHDFFIYVDVEDQTTNVIYRREDGDIGLLEVKES